MRSITRVFLLLLIVPLAFAGCKKGEKPAVKPDTEKIKVETKDPVTLEIEKFFETYVNTDERPIAIMVDNDDKNARPHAGLDEAYLVYEMLIEGGSTRFMALYRSADTQKIGPIRSSRHYYLDYVMENDAIYTHFGWSPKAMQDISAFGIDKINGVLGTDEDIFWREKKFKGDWHSAYTSIENIKNKAQSKKMKFTTKRQNAIKYADSYIDLDTENTAVEVTLRYSQKYTTGYIYNAEKEIYEKTIDGQAHIMQSGNPFEVKNIIVQLIPDSALGDGSDRRNIDTTGSGKGYYITGGEYEEITWSKSSRTDNTVYKKADGTELLISPGKTVINIISPYAEVAFK